jgi:chorismate dehydratase
MKMNDISLKIPGNHELVETADGSITLKSKSYDESCHSSDGARSETIYNFIEGCQVTSKAARFSPLVIFETGLGLGYGLNCTLEAVENHPMIFISTEIDPELIEFNIKRNEHPLWNNLTRDHRGHFSSSYKTQKLVILEGDATQTISNLELYLDDHRFHAIFQDAFSPRKNPELWTKEWFSELKHYAHEECILSTYCASRPSKEAMTQAGWKVSKRSGFGRKKSATIATIY